MTLERKLVEIRYSIFEGVSSFFDLIATKFFNYPENPGMPIDEPFPYKKRLLIEYINKLPVHTTQVPPEPNPQNLIQAIFGNIPKSDTIEKIFYEHDKDGFYNFYIENYRNVFFLPDWLSEWIQINLDITIDTTMLEMVREGIFLTLIGFMFLMQLRLTLYWLLTINPYTRPWVYMISLTDWVFDVMAGLTPVILGLDLSGGLILGLTGRIADTLNHLVFTMPFLPSEGQPGKMFIDEKLKDVIIFRYLPSLWYTHPIPDHLREFWYSERPEIYNFMKKNYKHLDIEFLPNRILKEMYEHPDNYKPLVENFDKLKNISTQTVCDFLNYSHNLPQYFIQKQSILAIFVSEFTDKLNF